MRTGTIAKAAQIFFETINVLVSANMLVFFAVFALAAIPAHSWWPFLWSFTFLVLAAVCFIAHYLISINKAQKAWWFAGIICEPVGYSLILVFWATSLSAQI